MAVRSLVKMLYESCRRRTSPGANQPVQTLSQLLLAYRPRNAEYNVPLQVEKCRCGNGSSHPKSIEIVTIGAQADDQTELVSAHKGTDLFSALGVID